MYRAVYVRHRLHDEVVRHQLEGNHLGHRLPVDLGITTRSVNHGEVFGVPNPVQQHGEVIRSKMSLHLGFDSGLYSSLRLTL